MVSKKDLVEILKPVLIGTVVVGVAFGSLMSLLTGTMDPRKWGDYLLNEPIEHFEYEHEKSDAISTPTKYYLV